MDCSVPAHSAFIVSVEMHVTLKVKMVWSHKEWRSFARLYGVITQKRDVARVWQVFQAPQVAGSKGQQNGQQIEYFRWEKFDFHSSTNFKLLR